MTSRSILLSVTLLTGVILSACLKPYTPPTLTSSDEFQVNTLTAMDQLLSDIAMDSSGNFVVVWQNGLISAQRFDSAGVAQGSEFKVTTSESRNPQIAMDANGSFVVVYEGIFRVEDSSGVYAQRFDNTGIALDEEFQVNSYIMNEQKSPSIAMDVYGNFVVVWESVDQDGDSSGIYAQRFNSAGAPQGSEFQVNTFTASAQAKPAIAMDANGNFVVAWQSYGQSGDYYSVYAQRFDSSGVAQGSEFQVHNYTDYQGFPAVAMGANGNFVVTWYSNHLDGDGHGIFAQRFDSFGASEGVALQVNTHTVGSQRNPSIAMGANSNYIITWTSFDQDGDREGVFAQRFDSAGVAQGAEFQVNTHITNDQAISRIAMDSHEHGNFVITWTSLDQDGDGWGIFAKHYHYEF